jgi:hypothetical protein
MNQQRAESWFQVIAVAGLWIAFGIGWAFNVALTATLSERGGDLPAATLLWQWFADSWGVLAIPVGCTVLLVWIASIRSLHRNWVAGSLLFVVLLYSVAGQVAVILPTLKLCSSLCGCKP